MVVARSRKETFTFITTADRELPEAERTAFTLGVMPSLTNIRVSELAVGGNFAAASELALKAGVRGWANLRNEADEAMEPAFDKGKHMVHGVLVHRPLSEASIDLLDSQTATELVQELLRINNLTDDDVKN